MCERRTCAVFGARFEVAPEDDEEEDSSCDLCVDVSRTSRVGVDRPTEGSERTEGDECVHRRMEDIAPACTMDRPSEEEDDRRSERDDKPAMCRVGRMQETESRERLVNEFVDRIMELHCHRDRDRRKSEERCEEGSDSEPSSTREGITLIGSQLRLVTSLGHLVYQSLRLSSLGDEDMCALCREIDRRARALEFVEGAFDCRHTGGTGHSFDL